MSKDQSTITEHGAVELDESALTQVAGAGEWKVSEMDGKSNNVLVEPAKLSTAKISGFDGKGNDATTEDIVFVTRTVPRT